MVNTRLIVPVVLLTAMATVGCGDNDKGPTEPEGVTFPSLPAPLLAEFCVRGNVTKGQVVSDTLTSSDCDAADFDPDATSYFESWRVRVASSGRVTFDANSEFDNMLGLSRLISYDEATGEIVLSIIAENDDRGPEDLNALVSGMLQPNTDYFISIAGFDYSDTGPYTIDIR